MPMMSSIDQSMGASHAPRILRVVRDDSGHARVTVTSIQNRESLRALLINARNVRPLFPFRRQTGNIDEDECVRNLLKSVRITRPRRSRSGLNQSSSSSAQQHPYEYDVIGGENAQNQSSSSAYISFNELFPENATGYHEARVPEDDDVAMISGSCDYLSAKHIRKACTCTRSRCLKLYCECFSNGFFCKNCNCTNCANNILHEDERNEAISTTLSRNPAAFRSKMAAILKGGPNNTSTASANVTNAYSPLTGADADSHTNSAAATTALSKVNRSQHRYSLRSAAAMNACKATNAISADEELQYLRGCNCKKSNCLKNYCECYEARVPCGPYCKCDDCKNTDTSFNMMNNLTFQEKPLHGLTEIIAKVPWLMHGCHSSSSAESSSSSTSSSEDAADVIDSNEDFEKSSLLESSIGRHEDDYYSRYYGPNESCSQIGHPNQTRDEISTAKKYLFASRAEKLISYSFVVSDEITENLAKCLLVRAVESADNNPVHDVTKGCVLDEFRQFLKSLVAKAKHNQSILLAANYATTPISLSDPLNNHQSAAAAANIPADYEDVEDDDDDDDD